MNHFNPTFKQLARSAGYIAYQQFSSGGNTWHWRDAQKWSDEHSKARFGNEEEAYKDCCIQAGLVEIKEVNE